MTRQTALTMVAPVAIERKGPLGDLLAQAGADPAGNDLVPFGRLEGTHFGRLLLLDETTDVHGEPIPPCLLLMADFDGPLDRYLDRLVAQAGPGLDRLLAHCDGYPAGGATPPERLAYLRAHLTKTDAFYVNTVGRTVRQIQQEAQLREALQGFLDRSERELAGRDPRAARRAIRQFIAQEPALRWARRPAPRPGLLERLREIAHLVAVPLALLPFLPLILLATPFYALLLRLHEKTDRAEHEIPDPDHVERLEAIEDHVAQNQFSAVGLVKPGPFRLFTTIVILFGTNFGTRHIFNRASLAGITSIHFARWVFLDDRQRVIFCSNYDGSHESYMDDFIDKVAWGLNITFSNGLGYPKTRWLVLDGCRYEQEFKDYQRCRQVPTQVWFSAYPSLTAINVENNARIREGLYGPMSASAAEAWLRRL